MRILVGFVACFSWLVAHAGPEFVPSGDPLQDLRGLPLAQFMSTSEPIVLRHVHSEYTINFPVPDRVTVNGAKLHLSLANSNALVGHRSQLQVALNGTLVTQIKLDPENPRAVADISLPLEKLEPGYNRLQFIAAQHYTDEHCEFPEAPELWTQIDTVNSTLQLDSKLKPLTPSLAELPKLIDQKLPEYKLTIAHAGVEPTDAHLRWGSIVAQGAALRLRYVPLDLSLTSLKPSLTRDAKGFALNDGNWRSDAVLIGTAEELAALVPSTVTERIVGAYLGLFARPSDPNRFLLVVSGKDAAQVELAARAFALINFPYPETSEAVIRDIDLRNESAYANPGVLHPEHHYSFKELGYQTTMRAGTALNPISIDLRLPPDLYGPEDTLVNLRLHLAYGAAMRSDSVVNLRLNGVFEHAIHLKEATGAQYHDYQVQVPLRTFRAGLNQLTLEPVLTPSNTGECRYQQERNLVVTVYEDSRLELPPAAHYAELPDLNLTARTGFPYTRFPTGIETGMQILDRSPSSITAGWRMLAKLAQINQAPLFDARLGFAPITEDLDVILVGTDLKSAGELAKHAPLDLGETHRLRFPTHTQSEAQPPSFWDRFFHHGFSANAATGESTTTRSFSIATLGGISESSVTMAYESPLHAGRMVLASINPSAERLQRDLFHLTTAGPWSQLQGNLVVWKEGMETPAWQDTGERFHRGDANLPTRMGYHFSDQPWLWIAVTAGALLLFAALAYLALNRYQRRTHDGVDELEP